MSDRVYDGHTFIFGQDTDTDPSALNPSTAALAVNRMFRGGRNLTRPPFVHKPFLFDLDTVFEGDAKEYENVVRYGNFQGWMAYKKKKPGREDGIIAAIGGCIFFFTLVNEKCFVRLVTIGNDPRLMHTWFVQAEEWVYIQNGKDRPIFWNGLFPSTARRSDPQPELYEMPVGTVMAYIHGRVFVSNAFDQVAASDIVYGNSLTDSSATQRFSENSYWAEGGYFGMPTDLGRITGMGIMARQDYNASGLGELVVVGQNGAYALEASIPRLLWKTSRIQTMTMNGRGCVSPASVVVVNNDLWFRSDDGLASYQEMRYEQKQQLSFGKISRAANRFFDNDTQWLQEFASTIYFDNRIITTVNPFLSQPAYPEFGSHRFHRGMAVLDLDQSSGVAGDSQFNWDGLWTGFRPCGLIKVGSRAFGFSHDIDGQNRIYEITRKGINDEVDGKTVQTEWFYLTKRFDWKNSGKSNEFEVKKIVGGELWVSDVRDIIEIGVDFRADNMPYWSSLMKNQQFGSKFDTAKFSLPRYERFRFQTPETACSQGAPYPSNHGSQHQIMIYGKGSVRIDRMRVAMGATNSPSIPTGNCGENNSNISIDNGKIEDEYSYNIASR